MAEKIIKTSEDITTKLALLNAICPQGYRVEYGIYRDYFDDGKVWILYGSDNKVHYTRKTYEGMKELLAK